MKCKTCGGDIGDEWRSSKKQINRAPLLFCSRRCSNTRQHSTATKLKTSSSIKKLISDGVFTHVVNKRVKKVTKMKLCNFCKKEFLAYRKTTSKSCTWPTTCSDDCYLSTKRKNARGNKSLTYKGMHFDSQWELDMVYFFEENDISFIIPAPIKWVDVNGKEHRYFPDFYIPNLNLYVDPKNPLVVIQQRVKLETISDMVDLIYGNLDHLQSIIISKWRAWRELNPHVSS